MYIYCLSPFIVFILTVLVALVLKTKKTVFSKRHELFEREVAIRLEPVGVEVEGSTQPPRMVTSEFDWWSKYYTSLPDHPLKHDEYENAGMDTLKVCEGVCEGMRGVCEKCVDCEVWTS